jgi:hypothetical protein
MQRHFPLLKTSEWAILAQQPPEIRETRGSQLVGAMPRRGFTPEEGNYMRIFRAAVG